MSQLRNIEPAKEQGKQYSCFKCYKPIKFISGKYKKSFTGKAVLQPFNLDDTPHICSGTGGNHEEARQRSQGHSNSSYYRYLRWYWGYGPGRYHRENEKRYSSDEYRRRREEAKQRYNNYRQQYKQTSMTKEEACKILDIAIETLTKKFDEAYKIIRSAYAKLALQFHPDRNHSEEAPAQFRKITEAFELLTEKRMF